MPFTEEEKVIIKHYHVREGLGAKALLKKFPEKPWTRGGLDYLLRKIDETGSVERRRGSGRPKTIRTGDNIAVVDELAQSQENEEPGSHDSPREIEFETGIARSSVRRILKRDLRCKTLSHCVGKKLCEREMNLRVLRGKRLLRLLTWENLFRTFFTDETMFKLGSVRCRQNDRFYAKVNKKSEVPENRLMKQVTGYPTKLMVSAAVSKLGKTSIIFVESGLKVDGEKYRNHLLKSLIPQMKRIAKETPYIFQQDGATAHTATDTIEYLQKKVPQLIPPDFWPPSSPDLNPLDYGIWSVLKQKVYRKKTNNVDELKERIQECWKEIDQDLIDKTIDRFCMRVQKMLEVEGRRFEHLLKL